MNGHKWELFIMGLSFLGWLILSALTFGIGLLWLLPYIQVTLRIYYLSITGRALEIGKYELNQNIEVKEEDFEFRD